MCGEVIEKVGLLSPTCHHVASSPCSLPALPINLRQSAEQKQTSFSLSCPTTSSRGFWTLAPSPPALQACTSAGWLFYTHLQTHLRSQTTPSSTSFPIVLPLWLPGPLPPPSFNPLPFALHPSLPSGSWVSSEWVERGSGPQACTHKQLYSQAPPGRDAALHAFLLSPLPFPLDILHNVTILHHPESECHENLCLCSKSFTLLNAI